MALYLVTGGAGFIGSHITTALVARGDRVRVLDSLVSGASENLEHLEVDGLDSGAPVEFLRGDVRDEASCEEACRGVVGVFHEAAQVSVPASVEDPEESFAVNVTGTLRILEAARAAGVERVVFAASSAAYGDDPSLPKVESQIPNPLSPYAAGKVAGESLMSVWGSVYGMKTVSLRYFNVFGPRQADDSPYSGVIAIFARRLLEGKLPAIHGDGEQTRDFVFISDVVRANLAAMGTDCEPGEVFNVGTAHSISVNELLRTMAEIAGLEGDPEHLPSRSGDVRHSRASIDRIRSRLGYEPETDLREGLEETLAWYRARVS
ncbi:MAG: LPS biosynthesis protein WbpP [Planctomycetes bacterium]|nr:LPS biosynthesis protein WbpP [Planctomycetota bacterium]